VVDFSDMMILGMAFPNIIGLVIMSGEVKADLRAYWKDLKEGRIVKY
jgi:AGCS family alanine or glycine:cation symporter